MAKETKFEKMLIRNDKSRSSFDDKISKKILKDAEKEFKNRELHRLKIEQAQKELLLKRNKLEHDKQLLMNKLDSSTNLFQHTTIKEKLASVERRLMEVENKIEFQESQVLSDMLREDELKKSIETETLKNPAVKKKPAYYVINSNNKQQKGTSTITAKVENKEKIDPSKDINININVNVPTQTLGAYKNQQEEINEIKRLIAIERGIISPNDLTPVKDGNIVKPKEVVEEEVESENTSFVKTEKHKASKTRGGEYIPPEESLPDSITDEDIETFMEQEQKAKEEALKKEEEEANYEGMSAEEIADAKKRKKKLRELQARYNTKETNNDDDIGDYRKNLDFTMNTSIKRFRVKPPKKPFIIAFSIIFGILLISGLIAYFIINRPDAPVVLKSLKLSQTTTYQYVGEQVDLRGVYLQCTYTDGTTKQVKVTENMISKTSNNVSKDLVITNAQTSETDTDKAFVYFTYEGMESRLDIRLSSVTVYNISVQIFKDSIKAGEEIKFSEILILANTSLEKPIKIDSASATYFLDKAEINNQTEHLTATETGIMLPSEISGLHKLSISCTCRNKPFILTIDINIEANS